MAAHIVGCNIFLKNRLWKLEEICAAAHIDACSAQSKGATAAPTPSLVPDARQGTKIALSRRAGQGHPESPTP